LSLTLTVEREWIQKRLSNVGENGCYEVENMAKEKSSTTQSTSRRNVLKTSLAGAAVAGAPALHAQIPKMSQAATPIPRVQPDFASEHVEETVHVLPPISHLNLFADATIPQHPYLGDNSWNSAHQDAHCSESDELSGPNGRRRSVL
jgi:hypothetical protein